MQKKSKFMEIKVYKYLFDITDSIEIIENHLLRISSLTEYTNDLKTIDAVERRLSIIGEALNKAVKLNTQLEITNKSKIISLRHILIHNYDVLDDATIWTITQKDLPVLKNEVELLLKNYDGSSIN
jgi:uncharacterized protein with HEPN domain